MSDDARLPCIEISTTSTGLKKHKSFAKYTREQHHVRDTKFMTPFERVDSYINKNFSRDNKAEFFSKIAETIEQEVAYERAHNEHKLKSTIYNQKRVIEALTETISRLKSIADLPD